MHFCLFGFLLLDVFVSACVKCGPKNPSLALKLSSIYILLTDVCRPALITQWPLFHEDDLCCPTRSEFAHTFRCLVLPSGAVEIRNTSKSTSKLKSPCVHRLTKL